MPHVKVHIKVIEYEETKEYRDGAMELLSILGGGNVENQCSAAARLIERSSIWLNLRDWQGKSHILLAVLPYINPNAAAPQSRRGVGCLWWRCKVLQCLTHLQFGLIRESLLSISRCHSPQLQYNGTGGQGWGRRDGGAGTKGPGL